MAKQPPEVERPQRGDVKQTKKKKRKEVWGGYWDILLSFAASPLEDDLEAQNLAQLHPRMANKDEPD